MNVRNTGLFKILLAVEGSTYNGDVFGHLEIDELGRAMGVNISCSYRSLCCNLLILHRLAHAGEGQFFFFSVTDSVYQLEQVFEAVIFKLHKVNSTG
jgi:hypothetical protein